MGSIGALVAGDELVLHGQTGLLATPGDVESLVACLRNVRAFTLFGLGWIGVFLFGGLVVTLFAAWRFARQLVRPLLPAALQAKVPAPGPGPGRDAPAPAGGVGRTARSHAHRADDGGRCGA